MKKVGVPDDMIGFEWPGIDPEAFVRYAVSLIGGNINTSLFPDRQPAINLDCGVLDPNHPKMAKVPSWAAGPLKDRVDAAIAHEYTEALVRLPAGLDFRERVNELHQQAIKDSPGTKLKITPGARKILTEYHNAMGF